MKGAHIKQDKRIYGATLLDVTPTLLTLFGLPVGEDLDGRVLAQAFEEPPTITRIPSWEDEPGECGMHAADLRMDPAAAQAVLQQFVALGYIQPPSENQAKAVESAVREQHYNLARVYLDSRRYQDALPLLEDLVKNSPNEARFQQNLAHCHFALGHRAEAKAILEQLIACEPPPQKPREGEAENVAANAAGELPSAEGASVEPVPVEAAAAEPSPKDSPHARRPWADLLMGIIQFEEGDMDAALISLLKAESADPRLPDLHLRIGQTYLRLRRTADAERAFLQALDIDGDSPEAHLGLAMVRLRQRRNDDAAEQALLAVGLQHFLPSGHFHLGVALARLGQRERSALAFETAASMLPGLLAAHRWLAALYTYPGGDPEKAARHRSIYLQLRWCRETAVRA